MIGPVGSTAIVVWSASVARKGVPSWDAAAFRRINDLPNALAPFAWIPMQAGALGAPLAIGAVLAATGDRASGLRVASTGLAAWAGAKALKKAIARGRPGDHDDATILRMGSADHGLGYPSGHAAVVATLVPALTESQGGALTALGIALAGVVGVSRIYVGAHYPLDVIGGYGFGAAIASIYGALDDLVR
ncbi:phosphatase PAP2 family protein [Actinomycetota bacterium]|jgi:membrane-associated phospholipid phosphatase